MIMMIRIPDEIDMSFTNKVNIYIIIIIIINIRWNLINQKLSQRRKSNQVLIKKERIFGCQKPKKNEKWKSSRSNSGLFIYFRTSFLNDVQESFEKRSAHFSPFLRFVTYFVNLITKKKNQMPLKIRFDLLLIFFGGLTLICNKQTEQTQRTGSILWRLLKWSVQVKTRENLHLISSSSKS